MLKVLITLYKGVVAVARYDFIAGAVFNTDFETDQFGINKMFLCFPDSVKAATTD